MVLMEEGCKRIIELCKAILKSTYTQALTVYNTVSKKVYNYFTIGSNTTENTYAARYNAAISVVTYTDLEYEMTVSNYEDNTSTTTWGTCSAEIGLGGIMDTLVNYHNFFSISVSGITVPGKYGSIFNCFTAPVIEGKIFIDGTCTYVFNNKHYSAHLKVLTGISYPTGIKETLEVTYANS